MRRTLAMGLIVPVFVASLGALAIAPAQAAASASVADTVSAATNFAWLNALRVADGVAPVAEQSWIESVAQAHSLDMANTGSLFHNMTGYMDVGHGAPLDAIYLGENVAEGTNLNYAQAALLNSPPHMAILLDPRYNYVGVAAATDASGQVWVTEDFAEVGSASVQAAAAPKAAPSPAPAPRPAVVAAKPAPVVVRPVAPAPKPVVPVVAAPVASPAPVAVSPPAAPAVPIVVAAPAGTLKMKPASTGGAAGLTAHAAPDSRTGLLLYGLLGLIAAVFCSGLGYKVSRWIVRP
jgi:hypothetical protein